MLSKNDIIELSITDISNDGSGIGRYEGIPVFVPLSAIGDVLKVKVLKVKKNLAFGKIEEILSPSKDRINPDCPVFSKCGGCAYRHISYSSEIELKANQVYNCIKRIGGIDKKPSLIMRAENTLRYRNKAQLPVDVSGNLGFYAGHSHRVIPHNDCLLQPESFTLASKTFEDFLKQNNISVYNEETAKGLVRHFYLRCSKAGDIMAAVVINGDDLPKLDELKAALRNALGEKLLSLQLNINKQKNNVIMGNTCLPVFGKATLPDTICGVNVNLSPLSFYQVNRDMAELLYKKAGEYAKPKDKIILDLYCGAGTIGLSMANAAKRIIGVEIIPDAVENARQNAKNMNADNTEFICGDVDFAASSLKERGIKPDTVILDPPRKGCSSELIKTVALSFKPQSIVYVSCDSATLARDIAVFDKLGYTLEDYSVFDLFPRTKHTECIALIKQSSDIS